MTFDISEVIRIVGLRQTVTASYDSICIIPRSVVFSMSNPVISLQIATTNASSGISTKLVPLRMLTRRVDITGYIIDGNDTFSASGVSVNDTTGAITGGTAITSIMTKKWTLDEICAQGNPASLIFQYRGVIAPIAYPTPASDATKNNWHRLCTITELKINDSSDNEMSPDASAFSKYVPARMGVTMSIMWGNSEV